MLERWLPLLLVFIVQHAAADPSLDQRMKRLTGELRCVVCQNQTLEDSNAPLALDLKKQIEEQLTRGASDEQVIDYLVQRYGDFVLYRPPVRPATWLLWFGPFAMLAGGLAFLFVKLRQRVASIEDGEAQA